MWACAWVCGVSTLDPYCSSGSKVVSVVTYAPCIGCDEQHFLGAEDGLAPRLLSCVQFARLGPRFDIRRAVLQQCCHCCDCVLWPAERLEHSDSPLAYAHVCWVLAQDLLIAVEHLLQVAVGMCSCLVEDAA